jgi:hypothetical protein
VVESLLIPYSVFWLELDCYEAEETLVSFVREIPSDLNDYVVHVQGNISLRTCVEVAYFTCRSNAYWFFVFIVMTQMVRNSK